MNDARNIVAQTLIECNINEASDVSAIISNDLFLLTSKIFKVNYGGDKICPNK